MSFILETERLIMRPIGQQDVEDLFRMDSNPNVHEYLWGKPATDINQTKFLINTIASQYIKHKIGRYAILFKETNEFIGWGGLKFNENTVNGLNNFYDVGICIDEAHWNKKLGFEIFHVWIKYAFKELKLPKIYAYTQTNNPSSNKMAHKIHMRLINEFIDGNDTWNWYELGTLKYDMIIKKELFDDIKYTIKPIIQHFEL